MIVIAAICDCIAPAVSIIVAGVSAYLGFWLAKRRDDRNIIQGATLGVAFWLDQISRSVDDKEAFSLHRKSVTRLYQKVINASLLLGGSKRQRAQKAWKDYSELQPSGMRPHEYYQPAGKTFDGAFHGKPYTESGRDAIIRTLQALHDSML